ncbi:putative oxidoreductase [Catenuloplanes atrovinosus]|uniref:Oxidoreductase n=2 Tax=Catenuloplanes atrovinosus TaxID=137266 RepID=A0AAE3YPU6_9ACTN|nr:putative oxidoreductase [Catenuloplanes atrovinosus]
MFERLSVPVTTLFRVVVGLIFAVHGSATVLGLFGGSRGTGEAVAVGLWPGWYAGVIQLVAGTLVVVGLATRVAALLCSGSMAYAYFVVHQPDALAPVANGGEAAALFCWAFLLIAVLGPGPYSLDALLTRRTRAAATPELQPAS